MIRLRAVGGPENPGVPVVKLGLTDLLECWHPKRWHPWVKSIFEMEANIILIFYSQNWYSATEVMLIRNDIEYILPWELVTQLFMDFHDFSLFSNSLATYLTENWIIHTYSVFQKSAKIWYEQFLVCNDNFWMKFSSLVHCDV